MRQKVVLFSLLSITLFLAAVFFYSRELAEQERRQDLNIVAQQAQKRYQLLVKKNQETAQQEIVSVGRNTRFENKTFKYEFLYPSNLVIGSNSSDEQVILSDKPDGHWVYSIKTTPNTRKDALEPVFDQVIESLNLIKANLSITDILVGNTHAKKYLYENYTDYGNAAVVFLNKDMIFVIRGHESTTHAAGFDKILKTFSFGPPTEKFLRDAPYFIDEDGIYYREQLDQLNSLEGVDKRSFKKIGVCASVEMSSGTYAQDKDHVYINGDIAEKVDSKTFKYFGSFGRYMGMPASISIAKDKNSVYFGCGKSASSVRKESFKVLDFGFSKDSQAIYYLDSHLKVADHDTFEIIGLQKIGDFNGPFALDKNNVYFEGLIIQGVSPEECKLKGILACLPENWNKGLKNREQSLVPLFQ